MVTEVVLEERTEYDGPPDYDGLWKKVIEDLFAEFMQFFASDLYEEIDFTVPPNFRGRELYKELIKGKKGRNDADQIVEVALKDGEKKWIIVHIEVQGEYSKEFPKRMFRYFYRIYDKFEQEVFAIALLTEDRKSKFPDHFQYSFHGTKVEYAYNVYKFSDHSTEELEQSTNPFAAAVIAGKYASKYRNNPEKRFHFKRKLMKQILQRYSLQQVKTRTYISALFYFIDYLLRTPEERKLELRNELFEFLRKEGGQQMHAERTESPTLAGIYEELEKRAKEKGMKEGMREAKENVAVNLIKEGFSDEKAAKLTGMESEDVMAIRKKLKG